MSNPAWSPGRFFLAAGCLFGVALLAGIVGTLLVVGSVAAKNDATGSDAASGQREDSDDSEARPSNAEPSVALFKQVLDASLQKLKPTSVERRTVLFERVKAGEPDGDEYPFEVTATIHDYDAGYPSNAYYGQTCVGTMSGWKFVMSRNDLGEWRVQGRMTVTDGQCGNNPSEGESAFPLAGLSGEPTARPNPAATAPAPRPQPNRGQLSLGEYACYGVGTRLMAGMGFRLKSNGSYADLDGGRRGRWTYDADASTISFRGGFLDGQTGRNVRSRGFDLSSTVNCEPWK